MADIRIKDLPTTATQTASDDFIALDGTVNGTRKIDASAPSFKTSVTSPSVVAPATTNLTLAGGSTGASLVLGQGTSDSTALSANVALYLQKGNTNAVVFRNNAAGSHTEYMRLSGTGNLLIGGTTDITGSGGLKVYGTTAASSTASGALQVAGGVGITGAIYAGGNIVVTGGNKFALGTTEGNGFRTTDGYDAVWSAASLDLLRFLPGGGSGVGRTAAISHADGTSTGSVSVYGAGGASETLGAYINLFGVNRGGALAGGSAVLGAANQGASSNQQVILQTRATNRLVVASGGDINIPGTTSASSSIAGALTIGNGSPATNVAIGGGNVNAGGTGTFGGLISTTSTGFSAINASGSVEFLGSRSSTSGGVTVTYKTGATTNWFHGLRGLVDNNWYLFNNNLSTNTLIFNSATDAATFAGAVTIAGTAVTLSGVTPVIDMGSKTSANNPIIDFNSSGNSNDFDVRLAAKGGTSPSGTGTLTVHGTLAATASNVGAFIVGDSGTGTPTAATSVAIGSGKVNIGSTTAGSAGAGALVVSGGLATGAASYIGGNLTVTGTAGVTLSSANPSVAFDNTSYGGTDYSIYENASGTFAIYNGTDKFTLTAAGAATFAGAVTGLRFIASTSLIAGDFTSTNDVAIVAKSTTATYNPEIAAFLAPSQLTYGVGAYSNVYCGVAQSAYNSGSLMFAYTGAGSTSNAFGLGMHGQLPTILINGSKQTTFAGLIFPQQAVTASAPTYVKGAIYFDTTLNKLRVGGATGWETITSV